VIAGSHVIVGGEGVLLFAAILLRAAAKAMCWQGFPGLGATTAHHRAVAVWIRSSATALPRDTGLFRIEGNTLVLRFAVTRRGIITKHDEPRSLNDSQLSSVPTEVNDVRLSRLVNTLGDRTDLERYDKGVRHDEVQVDP
jgi:hypothetical protein